MSNLSPSGKPFACSKNLCGWILVPRPHGLSRATPVKPPILILSVLYAHRKVMWGIYWAETTVMDQDPLGGYEGRPIEGD